jgi:HEAT repeat protein
MMRKLVSGTVLVLFLGISVFGAEVEDLIAKLKDSDPDARRAAAKALAEAGGDAKAATPALVQALKDKDMFVRRFSAMALGEIGAEPKAALPGLKVALNDQHKEVQEAAAMALGKMGKDGVGPLVAVLKDASRETEVKRKAVEALGAIGSDARAAIPTLIDGLKAMGAPKKKGRNIDDVRADAAVALGNIATADDKAAVAALESLLDRKQRDRTLQKAAREALQKIKKSK